MNHSSKGSAKEVTAIDIIISNAGNIPIYEQIVSQFKGMILSGTLREGDALPSMRVLAKELRISVITTKRAYEDLERDGFIVSITGKGSFVASKNLDFVREERLKNIAEHMQKVCEIAIECGLSLDELLDILRTIYGGE